MTIMIGLEGDAVDGPVVCVSRDEVLQALNEIETGKVLGPSEVSLELIAACGGVGIQVKAEICQCPRWIWNVSCMGSKYSGFKGKGDIRNCSCYGAVKFLEHGLKVVEGVLEKRLCRIVNVNEVQIGFVPKRGTIVAVFILRRLQEMYHA